MKVYCEKYLYANYKNRSDAAYLSKLKWNDYNKLEIPNNRMKFLYDK